MSDEGNVYILEINSVLWFDDKTKDEHNNNKDTIEKKGRDCVLV